MACAAGTAWRNYFVRVNERRQLDYSAKEGQDKDRQLNNLWEMEDVLYRTRGGETFWTVKNGYIESTEKQLQDLNNLLCDKKLVEELMSKLRIGIQWDTQVTDCVENPAFVTQTYNSAISINYSTVDNKELWEPLAKLVLEASYEATLLTAVIHNANLVSRGQFPQPVLLTKVGAGVFGNKVEWVAEAIAKAIQKIRSLGCYLDIKVVDFGQISDYIKIQEVCSQLPN